MSIFFLCSALFVNDGVLSSLFFVVLRHSARPQTRSHTDLRLVCHNYVSDHAHFVSDHAHEHSTQHDERWADNRQQHRSTDDGNDANDSDAGSDASGSTDRPAGAEPEYATLVVHVTVGW